MVTCPVDEAVRLDAGSNTIRIIINFLGEGELQSLVARGFVYKRCTVLAWPHQGESERERENTKAVSRRMREA